jgi:hypothetical protein
LAPSAILRHRLSPSSCRLFGQVMPQGPTKTLRRRGIAKEELSNGS